MPVLQQHCLIYVESLGYDFLTLKISNLILKNLILEDRRKDNDVEREISYSMEISTFVVR